MRQQTLQNAVTIEYPDAIAFSGDRNVINVSSLTNDEVGARLTLSNLYGDSVTLEYHSENNFLMFNIMDTIRALLNGQHQTLNVSGNVSNGGVSYNITAFSVVVERGRTLNDRPHGCVRTMYYKDDEDLEKVNVYVPVSGTFTVGNYIYPLVAGVNVLNLTEDQYGTAITPPAGDFIAAVHLSYSHSDTPVMFGDLWKHNGGVVNDYTIQFHNISGGYDCGVGSYGPYFKLRFLNSDGCYETFIGKMSKQKRTVTYMEYYNDSLVLHNPNALVTNCKDEVTIGFDDIATDAYFNDIVFSMGIEYQNGANEWKQAILGTTNVTEEAKDGVSNFEVVLKIMM